MEDIKNYKVNHTLNGNYKLYVRIKGEEKIHDVCYTEEEWLEFRLRLVKDGLTDKFEFFFDFESKDGKPVDEYSIITLEPDGTCNTWPWVPDDEPNAKILGGSYECWTAPFNYLRKMIRIRG
jgi:hypothetical protein